MKTERKPKGENKMIQIKEVKNGNKLVKVLELEFGTKEKCGDYYYVQYNWPEKTFFNIHIDPSYDEMVSVSGVEIPGLNKEEHDSKLYYIEAFPDVNGIGTYIGAHGNSFEECENILWEEYQRYLSCPKHEFIRDDGTHHYSNGAGVCKHCGLFASNVLEPETQCDNCCIHTANLSPILRDNKIQYLCEDCYSKAKWEEKLYCRYLRLSWMQKVLKLTKEEWESCVKAFEDDSFTFHLKKDDKELKFLAEKVAEGVYLIHYEIAKKIPMILCATYPKPVFYLLTTDAIESLMQKRLRLLGTTESDGSYTAVSHELNELAGYLCELQDELAVKG